jgi:uncharacterized membrane protein YkoI
MKKISWFWVVICSLITIVVFVSWLQFGKLTPSADMLTEQEAQNLVQERYLGKVSQIKLANQQYHIELEKQNGLYTIILDADSGKVVSFIQTGSTSKNPTDTSKDEFTEDEIKEIILAKVNGSITSFEKIVINKEAVFKAIVKDAETETTITVDAVTGTILSSNSININEPPKRLSETEAAQIAKNQVQGEIEDIWLETKNDQTYYLVELETQDDREAIVQIQAITGEVMSVTWDDHNNKDKDKDNGNDNDDD